ncbi:hypothetical protein B0H11DRAFT_2106942 [Mycena galericulata]|nr:hypothetical protein B0H11DRAFT_2106942 [Mycena galericulata]
MSAARCTAYFLCSPHRTITLVSALPPALPWFSFWCNRVVPPCSTRRGSLEGKHADDAAKLQDALTGTPSGIGWHNTLGHWVAAVVSPPFVPYKTECKPTHAIAYLGGSRGNGHHTAQNTTAVHKPSFDHYHHHRYPIPPCTHPHSSNLLIPHVHRLL